MSALSPAFAFDQRQCPAVLDAARTLATELSAGRTLCRADITRCLTAHFGGSDAEGRWSVRDAHAALELAQVLALQASDRITLSSAVQEADQFFAALEGQIPRQTNRSDEQIEWQQFATPPRLAWLAARACAIIPGETVLEPSAGTGMLAVWAAKAEARLALNEISPLRRECLAQVFPLARITGHDAELMDDLLDRGVAPSAVLINPPYSHGAERGHDSRTGDRHLRSAWKRLASGGRMVAIMPEWFDCTRFVSGLQGVVALRLNVAVERAFVRQGTGITTRIVVLDKADSPFEPVVARTREFAELAAFVDSMPARAPAKPVADRIVRRGRPPLRLIAPVKRPLAIPAAPPVHGSGTAAPLRYCTLDEPAPIEAQVGHYLPYRPSRIVVDGAAAHPTPLVESALSGGLHRMAVMPWLG